MDGSGKSKQGGCSGSGAGLNQLAKRASPKQKRNSMLGTILVVVLILMLLGAIPTWPHSRKWGYYPSGGLGLILLILLILMLLGRF
jgi:hypothetical protein